MLDQVSGPSGQDSPLIFTTLYESDILDKWYKKDLPPFEESFRFVDGKFTCKHAQCGKAFKTRTASKYVDHSGLSLPPNKPSTYCNLKY